jgi:hypothetical protein
MPDPRIPNGSNRCVCTVCDEAFSTVSAFDHHWKHAEGLTCRHPAGIGLVKRGAHWGWPSPEGAVWNADRRSAEAEIRDDLIPTASDGPITQMRF